MAQQFANSIQIIARVSPDVAEQVPYVFNQGTDTFLLSAKPFEYQSLPRVPKNNALRETLTPEYIARGAWERFVSSFTFDGVSHEQSQSQFYKSVLKDTVDRVPEGQSATILIFGTKGSGRDFTFLGDDNQKKNLGIIPRIALDLLLHLQQNKDSQVKRELRMELNLFHHDNIINLLKATGKEINAYRGFVVRPSNSQFTSLYTDAAQPQEYKSCLPELWEKKDKYGIWKNQKESWPGTLFEGKTKGLRVREEDNRGIVIEGNTSINIKSIEDVVNALFRAKKMMNKRQEIGANLDHSHIVCTFEIIEIDDIGRTKVMSGENLNKSQIFRN
ncbi:MAG: hypothetical protein EZS28_026321, partial [Streblomastix strix]